MKTKTLGPLRDLLNITARNIEQIFIFIISLSSAYAFSAFIRFKASNPHEVSNLANITTGWNPENNYIRIIFIIITTVFIFILINLIKRKLSVKWFRLLISLFATASIFVGSQIPAATTHTIDSFHAGEQLAPTLAYMDGKELFSEIFTLHGAGQDILAPHLSFVLLNGGVPSIGVYIFFGVLLQLVSTFLFFVLVARIIKSPPFYLFTVLYFLTTIFTGFSYEKNISLYILIGIFWYLTHRKFKNKTKIILLAVSGLIASLSVIFSYDVAFIGIAITAILGIALTFLQDDDLNSFKLRLPKRALSHYLPILAIATGGVLGQLIIMLSIGLNNYRSMIQSLFEISRYQGLMFDYPVNNLTFDSFTFWVPIFALSLALLMVGTIFIYRVRITGKLDSTLLFSLILILLSFMYLRFGVGRPDVAHIAMASPFILLTCFYAIHPYTYVEIQKKTYRLWPIVLFIILLFLPHPTFDPTKVFAAGNSQPEKIKEFKNILKEPDTKWLSQSQLEISKYIKDNSTSEDSLFIVVPEPLYYYTTDLVNPSRFAISWFADSQQYTDELLEALKNNPPKFIIYDIESSPYRISDSIPIAQRFPEVDRWILDNYPIKQKVADATLLSR